MNKKVAIYIRVSTEHQIDKESLPVQRRELINYSKYILNIDNFEVFEDAAIVERIQTDQHYKICCIE